MYCGWELISAEERDGIARGVRENSVFGGPYHLSLFIVNRCNVRCFFCFAGEMLKTKAVLDWQVLRRALLEAIPLGLHSVSFSGGGEPLLYPQLDLLLDLLHEHHVSIDFINTNGVLLAPRLLDKLFAVGLRELTISLNETTPETYSRTMQCPPEFFQRILKAIAYFHELRQRVPGRKPQLRLQLMLWRGNFPRLEEMYDFAAGLNPDVLYLNTMEQLSPKERLTNAERQECEQILTRVFQNDRERKLLQVNLSQEGLQDFVARELVKTHPEFYFIDGQAPCAERIEYCYAGWYMSLIDALGDVYPCCYLMGDKRRSVGNLTRQSLREIWNGPDYQQFREEMRAIMLSRAQPGGDLSRWRYIVPACLARSACSFNLLLCSREFYQQMYDQLNVARM